MPKHRTIVDIAEFRARVGRGHKPGVAVRLLGQRQHDGVADGISTQQPIGALAVGPDGLPLDARVADILAERLADAGADKGQHRGYGKTQKHDASPDSCGSASAACARRAPSPRAPCRSPIGVLDPAAGPQIDALKNQIAAIDERLKRIANALQE